jgi:aminoglycoside phosphotransferase (APT) family kinase protein
VNAANLDRALARHLGAVGAVRHLQKVTGGATKSTWIFELEHDSRTQKLVMQITNASETEDPFASTKLSAGDDARLLRAAHQQGVCAPEVLAVFDEADGLGPGHLTRWVAGETLAPKILREDKYALARQVLPEHCAKALAYIHRIPLTQTSFLKTMDARGQWRKYRTIVDQHAVQMPALEWALSWVEAHLPAPVPLTVVHGDFRLGNLIVNEAGLACVIDWELAVHGDPMQDLAWLCLKTWRFGGTKPVAGMGARQAFYDAYSQASGHQVDLGRLKFWEAFGHLKWAIMCLSMGLGKPGVDHQAVSLEHSLIGRRVEEPLWDLLQMIEGDNDEYSQTRPAQ